MRCGKHEHQPGQRCPAKNAKCKDCHKNFIKMSGDKMRAPKGTFNVFQILGDTLK